MLRRFFYFVALAAAVFAPAVVRAQDAGASGYHPELVPTTVVPWYSAQDWLEAAWVVAIFIVMLAILYPTAWKQILVGLKAREERIRKEISDAEAARVKAEKLLGEYNAQLATAEQKVQDLLTKAHADAEKIAASIKAQAQADAEAEREKSRKDIQVATKDAMRQVYEKTADLATEVAGKIIHRQLTAKDQQDLVDETIGQIEKLQLGAK
jgi:F-type H+-transporting ATPase subunit b